MKRLLMIMLSLILMISFTACTGSSGGSSGNSGESGVSAEAADAGNAEAESGFQETVLLDESGVKIVATSLDEKALMGPELKVTVSNASGQNLTIQCQNVSVDGFMVDPIFSCDVADGKNAVDSITFMSSDLEEAGIEEINTIELAFHIFNSDSWDTYLDSGTITVSQNGA